MTDNDPAFSIWLLLGIAAFAASLGFTLVALLVSGRRIRTARQESATRVRWLEERVIALDRQQLQLESAQRQATDIAGQLQEVEQRLGHLEQRHAGRSFQAASQAGSGFAANVPPAARRPAPTMSFVDSLTRDAAVALGSLDGFRQFAQAAGGSGLMLAGSKGTEVVSAPDAVSAADLWAIPHGGRLLVYPGFNLFRGQSALLADSGRLAQDRLGWLFEVEPGERLMAQKPAVMSAANTVAERGILQVPF